MFQASISNNFFFKIIFYVLFMLIGIGLGIFVFNNKYNKCAGNFHYVNPVFACLKTPTVDKKAYLSLKANLISFINKEQKEGRVSLISLFFRDLEGGPTLGINDRENFIPASLLKLPVALTVLRLSEEEEGILSQKLMYNNEIVLDNNKEFPPEKTIQVNTPYTVEELVERTIMYSDNFALELLLEHIKNLGNGRDLVADTYKDLGILETNALNVSSVSTKGYSSIFRLLYNSSFLNSDNSEKLLNILSRNTFIVGLKSGLPKDIIVVNKFGERTIDATGEKQLHDCGIIYYPTNPYLLCVMTKGKNFDQLSEVIGDISKMVYEEVDSRRLK